MNLIQRTFVFVVALILVTGCSSVTESVTDMFKGEDNAEPPTPLTSIVSPVAIAQSWSSNLGKSAGAHFVNLKPVAADGRVFTASHDGVVSAVDAKSGSVVWQVNTNTRLGGGPGVGDGLVLVGSREGELIALTINEGQEVWRSRVTSEILSVPSAAAGIAVARAIDGRMFGISTVDGKRLWTYDRTVPVLTLRGSSSPVIAGGLVVYGSDSGKLTALSLKEGLPLWEKSVAFPSGRSELDRIVDIDGDPLIINGVVYAASYQGSVVAMELETSRTVWNRDMSTSAGLSADSNNIYATDAEGNVWALDRRTGSAVWKQDKLKYRKVTGTAVIAGHVVVGDFEGYLHWMSVDDGSLLGRIQTDSQGVASAPIVSDNWLYSYSNGGELTAISRQ